MKFHNILQLLVMFKEIKLMYVIPGVQPLLDFSVFTTQTWLTALAGPADFKGYYKSAT